MNKKHKYENQVSTLSEVPVSKALSSTIKSQLISIIQKMQTHSCSQIFLEPVDPQQFPDYHKFIHNPMDLSTIKKKLEKNKYQTIEDFRSDVSLIFSNCNIYNPPGSWARDQGQKLEEYWLTLDKSLNQYKEKSSHEKRSLHMVEVKVCESIIRKMLRNPYSTAFKDPVPTTIPMYHEIIKKPMDFTTLKTNLDNKKYGSLKEFKSDVKLIFNNCYTFNMEGSDLFVAAQKLEAAFDEIWERRHDLIRQATEKLAQKGYNVKHLKHRSSTILLNNATDSPNEGSIQNMKSKIKNNNQNDDMNDIPSNHVSKHQKNNDVNISSTISSSKLKQYPLTKKEKFYKSLNDDEHNYNRNEKEKDKRSLKKHILEESGYDDDDSNYYSSSREHRSKKKRIRYDSNNDDDINDMDIEYSNNNSKKIYDTNRNSSIQSRHGHGHHRHSSSSFYSKEDLLNRTRSPKSSKKYSSSKLKESSHGNDDDDDPSSDNQGNLKIKIKI